MNMQFFAFIVVASVCFVVVTAGPGDAVWLSRRPDGRCGPNFGNAACRSNECCSRYGWCGSTENHCNSDSLWIGAERNQIHLNSDPVPTDQTGVRFQDLSSPASLKALNWCGRRKVVALTFDDGPIIGRENTRALLDDLATFGIKATFFLAPESPAAAENRNPDTQCQLLKRMLNEGHTVAGHTMRHPDLSKLSNGGIKKEIDDYNQWYRNCVGSEPRFRGLRPPFGALTVAQRQFINNLGETVVTWNIDSDDWQGGDADTIYQNTINDFHSVVAQNGESSSIIVLHHDRHYVKGRGRDVLPRYIEYFSGRGYRFVNIEECIALCQSSNDCKMASDWPGVYGA